jgi:hypothetical protein
VVPQPFPTPEPYIFSPRELQRLAAYRAAVVAGFYNEQCDSSTIPPLLVSTNPTSSRRNN